MGRIKVAAIASLAMVIVLLGGSTLYAKTLYVGGTQSLTGPFAEDSAALLAAFEDYVKYVNTTKKLAPWRMQKLPADITSQHAEIGYRILNGSDAEILKVAASIAWTHHERWDGNGYPRKLKGEAIPVEGRIAAIADAFDALTTQRVYKPAFSLDHRGRPHDQTSWGALRP